MSIAISAHASARLVTSNELVPQVRPMLAVSLGTTLPFVHETVRPVKLAELRSVREICWTPGTVWVQPFNQPSDMAHNEGFFEKRA